MNLLSSTSVFSLFTLLSRVLGYARDILIAVFLGTSLYADVFFVAFRIPNTFRRLFSEGTFNAAFIPSYTEEKIKNEKNGKTFADEVFSLLLFFLIILILLVELFTPLLIYLIAPGFYDDIEKFTLATELTRITFPFLLFVTLSSFLSGILNTNNKFAVAAAVPIVLNIILILSMLFSFYFKLNFALNLSIAVTFSGILQMIMLIVFTRKYYTPTIIINFKFGENIKLFFRKLLPSIFSSGITQINILIGTIIASFQSGAVSYLYYADRIYQINLAVAGIAVGTVTLPNLAKSLKINDQVSVDKLQNKSLELCLLLSLPAAFGLLIASKEIVNCLFGYGSFDTVDVIYTSQALTFFALGVPAFALIKVLSNFYFARDNTKIPFYISFAVMVLNIFISVSLFKKFGFIIIPIATSVSTWIGVLIYSILLFKNKLINIENNYLLKFLKILVAVFLMCLFLNFSLDYFEDKFVYAYNFKLIYLIIVISLSTLIYLILTKLFGMLNMKSYNLK